MHAKFPFVLLLLLASSFFVQGQFLPGNTYFGSNNYIEYRAGNLPIIISAPHGGWLEPAAIPDRSCSACSVVKDSWTAEVTAEIDSAIRVVFGGTPHIIINRLHRKKLDANREIVEAALGDPLAEAAWNDYHDFIQAAKNNCMANYGSAIYIDMHAHGHPIQRIELGYLLNRSELNNSDGYLDSLNFQDQSSIKHLKNVLNPTIAFSKLLRGSECMGELLVEQGYSSVPSPTDPAPGLTNPFFSGGYNTARHGSRDSTAINGIQFELNYDGIRNSNANRNAFARGVACVLRQYLDHWYFDLDGWDPGHVVTSTSNDGPGSLRSVLLGAQDGTTITFAPGLAGDTIKLYQELQICSDLAIRGPGASALALSGEDTCRIFRIMPGTTVEISGLSLVNGQTQQGQDGGALIANGDVRLSNCVIANNMSMDDGGAISLSDSTSVVSLDSCLIFGNGCSDDGGAIRCLDGTLHINASTISNNFSASWGGGISMGGTAFVQNSTFAFNQATGNGGGIRLFGDASLSCVNTTIANNSCGARGGGVSIGGQASFNHCTIFGNTAGSSGGGLRVDDFDTGTIGNSLIAGNVAGSGNDIFSGNSPPTSMGYNFVSDTSGGAMIPGPSDQLGNLLSPLDPIVLPLGDNGGSTQTIALLPGSPCVDNAGTYLTPLLDQRGFGRPTGSGPDIGAYELCQIDTAVFLVDITLVSVEMGATYQWINCDSMTAVTGATNQYFTPYIGGNFAVIISRGACVDTSACFTMNTVGLESNDFRSQITVHPNPTSGRLFVEFGTPLDDLEISLYSISGELIQSQRVPNLTLRIEYLIDAAPGNYLLKVSSRRNEASWLIVKN